MTLEHECVIQVYKYHHKKKLNDIFGTKFGKFILLVSISSNFFLIYYFCADVAIQRVVCIVL